mgnify:CR=1 FL=1
METISYQTYGTCCKVINVIIDNDKIKDIEFIGGCQGNLRGIRSLVIGMNINDVIAKLKGIDCNQKGTSCPDQLATCLIQYLEKTAVRN